LLRDMADLHRRKGRGAELRQKQVKANVKPKGAVSDPAVVPSK